MPIAPREVAVSDQYDFDLLCLGAGPAGQRAAIQAAKLGRRTAVVERRRQLGGVSINIGTIPSKTLREAVLSFVQFHERFGRRPGTTLRADPEHFMRRVDEVVRRGALIVEQQLLRNDVAVFWGEASFVDPHRVVVRTDHDQRTVTAAQILIAVGTRAAPPPGVAADGETVATPDDVVRLKTFPRTMGVVGAGVIGMEYASIFAALGIAVTVIDRRAYPLEFLDREIVEALIHQMRAKNVTFRFGDAVERLDIDEGPPRRAVLWLESRKIVACDLVLFSVGRLGATEGLQLQAVGLGADDRGRLQVDEQFRTAVPHIFAAGDVVGFPSLAATSMRQGRLAALHALGVPAPPADPHFPIGLYSIPEISMVGHPEHALTAQRIPYETGVARYREIARGQILGDDSGLFKMLFHRDDRRLLGVHAIGTGATELIHIGQAVLQLGGGLDYFLDAVFNYPTFAECYKVAAFSAANKMATYQPALARKMELHAE